MTIEIPCNDGFKIVAERNSDKEFDKELFIYIIDKTGAIVQDIAVVRPKYHYDDNGNVVWEDNYNVLVYGDAYDEDFTNDFEIERYRIC